MSVTEIAMLLLCKVTPYLKHVFIYLEERLYYLTVIVRCSTTETRLLV
jgi:hypothetical protein